MWAHDTKGTSCRGLGKSLQDPSAVCGRYSIGWHCPVIYCGNRLSSSSLHPTPSAYHGAPEGLSPYGWNTRSGIMSAALLPPRPKEQRCLSQTFLWNLPSQASVVCISQQLPSSRLPQNSSPSFGGPVVFLAQSPKVSSTTPHRTPWPGRSQQYLTPATDFCAGQGYYRCNEAKETWRGKASIGLHFHIKVHH